MTTHRPDFLMRSRNGSVVAAVEVKNLPDLSPELASMVRQDLLLDDVLPESPFFLLLSQDRGFLWDNRASNGDSKPLVFQMGPVVERYFPHARAPHLTGGSLEIIVLDWLNELSRSNEVAKEPERTLAQAGLLDLLKGGTVDGEPWG
jgi:hypothetical protein